MNKVLKEMFTNSIFTVLCKTKIAFIPGKFNNFRDKFGRKLIIHNCLIYFIKRKKNKC